MKSLYAKRYFCEGYPDLEKLGVEYYKEHQGVDTRVSELITCIKQVINIENGLNTACVIGCGPNPSSVKELYDMGFDAIGIEPVPGSAEAAARFLNNKGRVINAAAEKILLPDNSQRIIFLESVLEHVDSPLISLSEAYRVLAPGGILYVYTTNKYRISLTGKNDEFNIKFYNWFPNVVKESYVFKHLHYDPKLANYSPRPAVHWFSYSELCKLGRYVGFSQFYSLIDLLDTDSETISKSIFRKIFLTKAKYNPWFRAYSIWKFNFYAKERLTVVLRLVCCI